MDKKNSKLAVIPVLFGFFIMGFADVVGISTSYVQQDFNLSDSMANLLPMMVFLWFAVFSVPTGMMMNKLGRKNTVLISLVVSLISLLVPVIAYEYTVMLFAFALLGIGNTILQVSLNPLLTNVVSQDKLTSSLTFGQFVKAIASFSGPIIAGFASGTLGNWKLIFPIFAAVTFLSGLWLVLTPIEEEKKEVKTTSFASSFGLLKDPVILMLFLGILLLVGIDVGLNTTLPKFLMERTDLPLERAGLGTSLYFAARTIGTFVGAILLIKFSGRKFYIGSMILGIAAMVLMIFISNLWVILVMIFCLGLAIANVFSIIFSAALRREPQRANEVSGLLIMGVAGGAIVPPLMGIIADLTGQTGAMVLLLVALGYLLFNAIRMQKD
ncbi:Fucose permease [Tangfeifania diversioriginum]|uniref:Fucose permease n=1 Tax=Tangfeifania diversioriginum TaxID=1168035 RepID=A0A1M6MXW9_9BACT|nr:MFS transporter [Tangfeifania diversioriginum]SHJ88296.1 Fucose permease [Tangfeifania diversioriginum]